MEREATEARYKWIVLAITTIGVLMVAIDTTVVILALPAIMEDLNSNLVSMIWVLMAYIFVSTVLLLALGRIADIYGRVRLYNLGFAIFTVGSALCGLSQSGGQLIGARVFQGAGGVIGPVLGGFILAVTTWRWIFLINVPIGIVGTVAGYRYLREMSSRNTGEHIDWLGATVFSISLFALVFALTQGIELGWFSATIITLFAVFLVGMIFFVLWERKVKSPALDLSLFSNRVYDFSVLAAMFQSLAIYAVQFLVVFYMQAVRGYDPLKAALLLLPMPIALAVIGPISGQISDRIGARIPATVGLLLQAAGVYWLSTLSTGTHYLHIAFGLGLTGLGGGLFFSPNTSAAMSSAPRDRLGVASATLSTLRNAGMVTSFAIALAVAASAMPRELMLRLFIGTALHLGSSLMAAFVDGLSAALRVSVVLCIIAAAMSAVRGREDRRAHAA